MKKLLLVLAFVAMSFVSNAQLFVAGSVSAKYSSGETRYDKPFTTIDNDPTEKGFVITPAVGYMIPGKSYGFGLSLGYAYTSTTDNDYHQEYNGDVIVEPYRNKYTNAFDIAPFFRYAYAKFEKITLYADLKIPVGFSNTKEDFDDKISDPGGAPKMVFFFVPKGAFNPGPVIKRSRPLCGRTLNLPHGLGLFYICFGGHFCLGCCPRTFFY